MMAERAKPDGHRRFRECHGLRVLVPESAARKQSGVADDGTFKLPVRGAIKYLEAACFAVDTTARFGNGDRGGSDGFGNQEFAKVHHFKYTLDWFRRIRDHKSAVNAIQLLVDFHEDADAHRADVTDSGQVQSDVIGAAANHVLEGTGEMISPVPVEPASNDEFRELTCLLLGNLHINSQSSPGSAS